MTTMNSLAGCPGVSLGESAILFGFDIVLLVYFGKMCHLFKIIYVKHFLLVIRLYVRIYDTLSNNILSTTTLCLKVLSNFYFI